MERILDRIAMDAPDYVIFANLSLMGIDPGTWTRIDYMPCMELSSSARTRNRGAAA